MDNCRLTSSIDIEALLQRLLDSRALVTLSGPQGSHYTTVLCGMDGERAVLDFDAQAGDAVGLAALLKTQEVTAVAYLDSIKVQFELDVVMRPDEGAGSTLRAHYPAAVYRFQRRSSFRVRPLLSLDPQARFEHPSSPHQPVSLRVLDISLLGVALLLPDGVPMVPAGAMVEGCTIELDADTRIEVGLEVHHVSVIGSPSQGARLGCELHGVRGESERILQRYIDQTQKRQLALKQG